MVYTNKLTNISTFLYFKKSIIFNTPEGKMQWAKMDDFIFPGSEKFIFC